MQNWRFTQRIANGDGLDYLAFETLCETAKSCAILLGSREGHAQADCKLRFATTNATQQITPCQDIEKISPESFTFWEKRPCAFAMPALAW